MGAPRTSRGAGLTRGETLALGAIAVVTAVAGALHYSGAPGVSAFVVATVALAGLAWIVSFPAQQGGGRVGPALPGLLQATPRQPPGVFLVRFLLAGRGAPRLALPVAIALLTIAGVGSAFVSDWFIAALDPAIKSLGISKAFAGLVIVAIAGNAVENVTGIVLAHKGQSDLAISVVKNSVAQIAAFLFPALVLVSLLFSTQLTFALAPVYIGAMLLTVIAVWQITGDGEANTFEGLALIGIYVIVAGIALYE